jgi:phosphoribosylformylglycinamidine cyclo-ligase
MAKTSSKSKAAPRGVTYADAGVDLAAADAFVDLIGSAVRRTYGPRVLASHGGFAGAFRLDYDEKLFQHNYREPVLMACTDGVGSKVLVAIEAQRFETIGSDLVAMNVNDLLCTGAEPLFFLDYLAVNALKPKQTAVLVESIARACEEAGCALLGGETAEMPALYAKGHFDLAGFSVGVVERQRIINGRQMKPGDIVLGLASSGIHSNGYALVRKLLLEEAGLTLDDVPRHLGEPLLDVLLRPTRIYVKPVLNILRRYVTRPPVTAMAHITGGGLPGNLPRVVPKTCDMVIRRGSWPIPPIFGLLQRYGVSEAEMYRVFNMGVGFVMVVRPRSANAIAKELEKDDIEVNVIGQVKRGKGRVELR